MKKRQLEAHDGIDPERALCQAIGSLSSADEIAAFLQDLCTPAELEALTDRWRVVAPLWRGKPYREIHERTAVSVTTIGRVARFLDSGQRRLPARGRAPCTEGGAGARRPLAAPVRRKPGRRAAPKPTPARSAARSGAGR
jgi:TrpR-related protein YerC/YecD